MTTATNPLPENLSHLTALGVSTLGVDWEAISPFNRLDRIRVPGGWIYRTTHTNAVALCFVPLVDEGETVNPVMPLDITTEHEP